MTREDCIIPESRHGLRSGPRNMCLAHYKRWRYEGAPAVFLGAVVPLPAFQGRGLGLLPNPWVKVAPVCPGCTSSKWVFLWAEGCALCWFCQTCRTRFDAVKEAAA